MWVHACAEIASKRVSVIWTALPSLGPSSFNSELWTISRTFLQWRKSAKSNRSSALTWESIAPWLLLTNKFNGKQIKYCNRIGDLKLPLGSYINCNENATGRLACVYRGILPRAIFALTRASTETVAQLITFDILKFSLIVRLRGHQQKKWRNMFIQFPLYVSSKPRCQAEFWYIEGGLLGYSVEFWPRFGETRVDFSRVIKCTRHHTLPAKTQRKNRRLYTRAC